MKTTFSRLALASTLFFQAIFVPSHSNAGPIFSQAYSGEHYVGPAGDRAIPSNFFAAQGFTVHNLTNDEINNSLVSINPNIFIAGVDSNDFVVPTLPGSPCRSGCSLVLDIEALQNYLGPTIQIAGLGFSMFQIGQNNNGWAVFRQGVASEYSSTAFSTQDQYTLQYRSGVLNNPGDVSGMSMEMGFGVGNDGLSRGLWGKPFYLTENQVNAVPEPGSVALVGIGVGALAAARVAGVGLAKVAVTLATGKVIIIVAAVALVAGGAVVLAHKPTREKIKQFLRNTTPVKVQASVKRQ